MNILASILAYGTSEGLQKAWDSRGRGRKEHESDDRSARAKTSYVKCTAEKQRLAEESEKIVAFAIKGQRTADNAPFDILKGNRAVEVKTIFPGVKNDKITMHRESRLRKEEFASKHKLQAYTVVIDRRTNKLYFAEGVKSYRLNKGKIREVTFRELKSILK